ncbi:MAG: putative transcriptional regulator [Rhodoglobus sp.]|nr:putative transcriptional regulator [Rhodoglobus sp.]
MATSFAEFRESLDSLLDQQSFTEAATALADDALEHVPERATELRERILRLPEELWTSHPSLALVLGASSRNSPPANPFAALSYVDAADVLLSAGTFDPALAVMSCVIRSSAFLGLGRLLDGLTQADLAWELLATVDVPLRTRMQLQSLALVQHGICRLLLGELSQARQDLEHALALQQERQDRGLVLEARGCLALVEYFAGIPNSPYEQVAWAHQARPAGSPPPGAVSEAPILIAEGLLAIDEGRIDLADTLLGRIGETTTGTEYELLTAHLHSIVLGARSGPREQLDALRDIRIQLRGWQSPGLLEQLHDSERALALIVCGEIGAARDAMTALMPDAYHVCCPARLLAILELHTGEFESALRRTDECKAMGDDHSPRNLAHVEVVRCVAHEALGDSSIAAVAADRIFLQAARTGWRRQFAAIPHHLLGRVIDAARQRRKDEETLAMLDELALGLDVEEGNSLPPLSSRERVILRHLMAGETQHQISTQLRVSPNTIKTQVRSIYRKLGAASRHEVIDRAQRYGISV